MPRQAETYECVIYNSVSITTGTRPVACNLGCAQSPSGGTSAFCLQCASVVAVAPLRGSNAGLAKCSHAVAFSASQSSMILNRLPMQDRVRRLPLMESVRRLYLTLSVFFVGVFHSPLLPRMRFADAAIESLMGFLFAICSILRRPFGVFVEDFDTSLQHGQKPVLRKVRAQRHCTNHFHMTFYLKEECGGSLSSTGTRRVPAHIL